MKTGEAGFQSPADKLTAMILSSAADGAAIASFLNGMTHAQRIEATSHLKPRAQRGLWKLCAGQAVKLEDIVPAETPPLKQVRHFGRNTLPLFTLFEKRFCRPPGENAQKVLWGYNEGATRPLIGPGYFVLRLTPGDERGEAVVDYYQVPPDKPDKWPAIRANDAGIQQFVYGFMHDFLRKVSAHVVIGRAYKHGKETANYFVLCREE
jgi:hypothetical protein